MNKPTVEIFQYSDEAAAALIRKIANGDKAALGTLYDHTSRLIFGLIVKMIEDRALAEEALLDAYTYVWKQAAFYNPKTMKPLEWLILIGRSRAVLHLNIGKQNPKGHSLPQSAASASEMSVAPEQQKLARDSIASLIPSQREVLESAFYSGLSCSDIAAQSGKPAGAVTTHIRLGLNKLDELFR